MDTIKALVIAGGGAADRAGGGAGGVLYNSSLQITPGTYSVTIGNGGAEIGLSGGNSVFSSLTAIGGGGRSSGKNGGSGSGGYSSGDDQPGGLGVVGQGYNGGNGSKYGNLASPTYAGGGGGGAGGVGGNGSTDYGGIGIINPIDGSTAGENISGSLYLAGGGHGNQSNTDGYGSGSYGGGGGGDGDEEEENELGNNGIVIISYVTKNYGQFTYTGTVNTIVSGDNTILEMTTSGTLTVVPLVTTQAVSSITSTTVTGNGTVEAYGSPTISERGTVVSLNANPTTSDIKDTASGTTGAYTTSITGLTRNTLYHIRAYAINENGTFYGNDVTFTTLAEVPTVTSGGVNSISQSSIVASGTLVDNGSLTCEIGFVFATTSNPTITDNKVIVTGGLGIYNTLITGLTANTSYHIRAYATNTIGTVYGDDIPFSTLASGPMVKRRISFLSKAQSLTIQLSNNAIDETFTVLQFAVAGEKQEKKTFTPGSIVSIN